MPLRKQNGILFKYTHIYIHTRSIYLTREGLPYRLGNFVNYVLIAAAALKCARDTEVINATFSRVPFGRSCRVFLQETTPLSAQIFANYVVRVKLQNRGRL